MKLHFWVRGKQDEFDSHQKSPCLSQVPEVITAVPEMELEKSFEGDYMSDLRRKFQARDALPNDQIFFNFILYLGKFGAPS